MKIDHRIMDNPYFQNTDLAQRVGVRFPHPVDGRSAGCLLSGNKNQERRK